MKVKLISYSQPAEEVEGIENVQDLIAYAARVSNPANQMNMETSERLLNYLSKHKHWSPFEMASACIEIETTRDIARQIIRHRSFSYQEFSQRYANPHSMEERPFVIREARLQDMKNRQNSIEIDMKNEYESGIQEHWAMKQERVIEEAEKAYHWAIRNGIAKEQARVVLPEGNTISRLHMNGTIRSWIHYIDLRSDNGTQKEHMEIAKAVAKAIAKIFPLAEKYTTN